MNKRTKLKIQRCRMFISRYVLNRRFIVRNTMAVAIFATVAALIIGGVTLIKGDEDNTSEDMVADAVLEETSLDAVIYLGEEPYMNSIGLMMVSNAIDEGSTPAEVTPVDTVMVTDSKYDSRFISVESGVNVRSGAGTDYEVTGYLELGMVGELLGTEGEWSKIKIGDFTGYVKSEFILSGQKALDYADANSYSMDNLSYYEATEEDSDDEDVAEDAVTDTSASENPTTEAPTTETPATEETTEAPSVDETISTDTGRITIETTTRAPLSLSQEDINLIAAVVALESGNEPYEGQLAVANVIINRYYSGRWGSTIKEVLYAKNQFSVVTTSRFEEYLAQGPSGTPLQATLDALAGTNNIGDFLSFRPTYFLNSNTYERYTVIFNHLFF